MAYMTKGLTAMQVAGKNGNIITLRERTTAQIYNYLKTYLRADELANFKYIAGSQCVSENNGYTYAKFTTNDGMVTLSVYDNPELGQSSNDICAF